MFFVFFLLHGPAATTRFGFLSRQFDFDPGSDVVSTMGVALYHAPSRSAELATRGHSFLLI